MTAPVFAGWTRVTERETVRVARETYRGATRADIRVCASIPAAIGPFPTGKALSIPIGLLPDLIAAPAAAETKERALGLIGGAL